MLPLQKRRELYVCASVPLYGCMTPSLYLPDADTVSVEQLQASTHDLALARDKADNLERDLTSKEDQLNQLNIR